MDILRDIGQGFLWAVLIVASINLWVWFFDDSESKTEADPKIGELWIREFDIGNPFNEDTIVIVDIKESWVLYGILNGSYTHSQEIEIFKEYKNLLKQ